MYQEEQKQEWMRQCGYEEETQTWCKYWGVFTRLDNVVETPLAQDIYTLVRQGRHQDVYDKLSMCGCFLTYRTLRSFFTRINAYIKWCYLQDNAQMPDGYVLKSKMVSLVSGYENGFIKTPDELALVLSRSRVEEGWLLPVGCALAWMGYTSAGMVELKEQEVVLQHGGVSVRGKSATPGFVADTIRYYATHDHFFRMRDNTTYEYMKVMWNGDDHFLRDVIRVDSKDTRRHSVETKLLRYAGSYDLTGRYQGVAYRELALAGHFYNLWIHETEERPVRDEDVRQEFSMKGQLIFDRIAEYQAYKTALENSSWGQRKNFS